MLKILVTGCAGFIGSSVLDRLLQDGHHVVGIDNFSTGHREFLTSALKHKNFELYELDLLDAEAIKPVFFGVDIVFHFSANADVRFGLDTPFKDLQQNVIATQHVLEAMRMHNVGKIAFSSTGSVYGEAEIFPTPETAPFPVQTSLYGASKAAAEGLISAYSEGYNIQAWIFRFVSILGERYTHGHVVDFYQKLKSDSSKLHILGDGSQRKSYLYIQDCIDAMMLAVEKSNEKVNIFNLGTDEYCEVNSSVQWITEHLELSPMLTYSGGKRGWVGDNPFIFLDTTKIKQLGWEPKLSIKQSILRTVSYLESETTNENDKKTLKDHIACQ